jgi:hypothetical protein
MQIGSGRITMTQMTQMTQPPDDPAPNVPTFEQRAVSDHPPAPGKIFRNLLELRLLCPGTRCN